MTSHIQTIFRTSRPTDGSPRVHATLPASGVRWSTKRVARVMRAAALVARPRRQRSRATDSRHDHPVAPNRVARNVQTYAPNQVWVADSWDLPTRDGGLYVAVVRDLSARRVVGWSMAPARARTVGMDALTHALNRRQPGAGLVHHRDRGSPYARNDEHALLAIAQIKPRRSRKGTCGDNAVMESFLRR